MTESACKCGISAEGAAAFLIRFSLGVLLLFAGFGKFMAPVGVGGVSAMIVDSFKDTYLPHFAVVAYTYPLPYLEVALGLWLISGLFSKASLLAAGLLLLSLAFGKMVQQDHATVAANFNYVFMAAAGLWFVARDNCYSLDAILGRCRK